MKKICGNCEVSDGIILEKTIFKFISEHIKSHTNMLITSTICFDCLFELFEDSQWSMGWKKMAHFLYIDIATMYHSRMYSPPTKKALSSIYSAGTSALASMCIACDQANTSFGTQKKGWLLEANNDLLIQCGVPTANHKDFDNLICEKCTYKYEKDIIKAIPKKDLPLHVTDKWFTKKAALLFEKKLKNG